MIKYRIAICPLNGVTFHLLHKEFESEEARANYLNYNQEQFKDLKVTVLDFNDKEEVVSNHKYEFGNYTPCFENYVIQGAFIHTAQEWDNNPENQKYDDVIHCRVDINSPDYPNDGSEKGYDKFENDLIRWWNIGSKPIYAIRM